MTTRNYALAALAALIATVATAAPISLNVTSVIYVTDGDTFAITTDTQHKLIAGKRFIIRIKDIDTPELKAKCKKERQYALDAKKTLTNLLNNAQQNNDTIEVVSLYKDNFGRLVANVLIHQQNGKTINVGNTMLEQGLALPYSTKGHKNNYSNFWCN